MKKILICTITVLSLIFNMITATGFSAKESAFLMPKSSGKSYYSLLKGKGNFPEKYSSAERGFVSGVDDQLGTAACWAFVHNELIETYVAKNTGEKFDLSEQTMKFETSEDTNEKYGYVRTPNEGGNEYISTAYISRAGVTLEEDEKFSESEIRLIDTDDLNFQGILTSVPMVEFGKGYQPQAIELIKKWVMEYGAVGSSMYFERGGEYQNEDRSSYYYNGNMASPDHAVTIIGWDDTYSAENFSKTPDGDGAFIVKNSWGKYHADKTTDLVYVSYYDMFINYQLFATTFEMNNDISDVVYQYDQFGWTSNGSFDTESLIYATRYTKKTPAETLSAVSTYVASAGAILEVYVNTADGDVSDKSKFVRVHRESTEYSGYYLMDFDDVEITGREFVVAIKVTMPKNTGKAFFPVQSNLGTLIKGATQIEDTCYISGQDFSSLTALEDCHIDFSMHKAMLCMKAFTKKQDFEYIDSSKQFRDVKENAWYKTYVDSAVTFGMFSGTGDNKFSPDMDMSRAQFVQVLANVSGANMYGDENFEEFVDVTSDKWFYQAVKWAWQNDIVSGTAKGVFSPDLSVTREQMCVMLANYIENYMGETLTEEQSKFKDDKNISSWAKTEVYKCFGAGLISGTGNNMFEPAITANRAVGATIFTDFYKNYILE